MSHKHPRYLPNVDYVNGKKTYPPLISIKGKTTDNQ